MQEPRWLPPVDRTRMGTPEDHMRLAVRVALASARNGGGPFGAIIADADGRVVDVGWNDVLASRDSTAHAEITAIRRAESRLGTHRLEGASLYASCAPCIQCYGAIYWSGLSTVYAACRKEDAETIGFDEGPPMKPLWEHARRTKGIRFVADYLRDDHALQPLREYRERGGLDYSNS